MLEAACLVCVLSGGAQTIEPPAGKAVTMHPVNEWGQCAHELTWDSGAPGGHTYSHLDFRSMWLPPVTSVLSLPGQVSRFSGNGPFPRQRSPAGTVNAVQPKGGEGNSCSLGCLAAWVRATQWGIGLAFLKK